MASLTQGNTLQDVLKWEQENCFSREAITVAAGQNLEALTVVGKITKSTPTTGTKAEANTGDGTCTGVTAGADTQIGTYTLTCTEVAVGANVVPTTGTKAEANTGDGLMTAVTGGDFTQVGTYTMTCTALGVGAFTVPATGTLAAVGSADGTCTDVSGGADVTDGTYTLTCVDAETNAGAFEVVGPDGYSLGEAIVGTAFVSNQILLTINDGTNDFEVGDVFTIAVTEADSNSGTFSVVAPNGATLEDATVGVAYTSGQINFTIGDGDTDFALADSFTVTVTTADHDSGTFSVLAPNGEALPDATVDSAYTNDQINFTINDGDTDFIVGDSFTIAVAAGSGKYVIIDFDGVDGSQDAAGFVIDEYDASSADLAGVAIVRDAIIVSTDLVWPTGATTDQKTAALAVLKTAGIVERDEV